ncbi:cytochrome P450 3A5-like [Pomacea canaliculata]|uniref:cytochrome P450 3A5-like n=1 Tax=Pomacea canaliculata TaxID=400727 RepID=UPI000D73598A|nr:cytochrome P450 3A5-like [Pomacea canaliculata]
MTPTFTGGKLKNMSHFVDRCANILKDNLQDKTCHKEVIDIKDVFGAFTMDVITGTAFGLETNSQTQPAEPFVQSCKNMFYKLSGNRSRWLTIAGLFPFLSPLIMALGKGFFTGEESDFLVNSVYRMVDERRQAIGDEKRTDFLQLLVNAEDTGLDVGQKRMTREEVAAQGVIILIAGYETTATTLQYLTYNLAMNQDVQQRVYEEMRDELGDEDPTYDNVGRLKYLDNVIHETLRLFPPVSLIHRRVLHSRTIKGLTIPAGVGVYIPIYSIMHDPDYFDDPEKFWPERFSEAESSKLPSILSELAFGYGPRQCIGMRLALLEIKFAAVRILRHFRFLPCEDTPDKIEFVTAGLTAPTKPIKLRTELRV